MMNILFEHPTASILIGIAIGAILAFRCWRALMRADLGSRYGWGTVFFGFLVCAVGSWLTLVICGIILLTVRLERTSPPRWL